MVNTWLNSGLTVTMWNRSPDRPNLMKIVKKSASFELELRTAVLRSDTIAMSVSSYDNVKELLSPILLRHLQHQARETEMCLKDNGVSRYFDGAIMVTPELVGTEHSSMFFSGENEAELSKIAEILYWELP